MLNGVIADSDYSAMIANCSGKFSAKKLKIRVPHPLQVTGLFAVHGINFQLIALGDDLTSQF